MTAPADAAGRDAALVTGEAVVLDLRPASFAARMLSFAIDGVLELAILFAGTWAVIRVLAAWGMDQGYVAAAGIGLTVMAFVGVPVLGEVLTDGRSLGRWALGTRVVRDDGGPVHARQSVLRAVAALLEIWTTSGAVALVVSLVDPRSRRIGDLMAGTFVVQERLRAVRPARCPTPASLAGWASAADVGRLPLPLLAEIRSFLPHAADLHERSRRALATDLVQQVVPFVAPPPPPGTDPVAFLQAVLGERSRRDEDRLRRQLDRERVLAAQVRALPFSE